MIVADTSAIIALIDADDAHHAELVQLFQADPDAWLLPWAILPEIDYLVGKHVGRDAQDAFLADLADGSFQVEWGNDADLKRANELHARHRDLRLGLVDAVVMAVAERLGAAAIATLDLRDFGSLELKGKPRLLPRDAS